jgi:predicted N-acyltransferase
VEAAVLPGRVWGSLTPAWHYYDCFFQYIDHPDGAALTGREIVGMRWKKFI